MAFRSVLKTPLKVSAFTCILKMPLKVFVRGINLVSYTERFENASNSVFVEVQIKRFEDIV